MLLNEIIDFLKHEETMWSSRNNIRIDIPFEISPEEYFDFAVKDYKVKTVHSLVNALSNAKSALDCRIDSLLIAFGIYEKAIRKGWSVPHKLNEISKYGVIAPGALEKMNSVRNYAEQQFKKPDDKQVGEFIDTVSLFLSGTEKYIYRFPAQTDIENPIRSDIWLDIVFDYDKKIISINIRNKHTEKEKIQLKMEDDKCIEFLCEYFRITAN